MFRRVVRLFARTRDTSTRVRAAHGLASRGDHRLRARSGRGAHASSVALFRMSSPQSELYASERLCGSYVPLNDYGFRCARRHA